MIREIGLKIIKLIYLYGLVEHDTHEICAVHKNPISNIAIALSITNTFSRALIFLFLLLITRTLYTCHAFKMIDFF